MDSIIKVLQDIFINNGVSILILTFGWIPLYLAYKGLMKLFRRSSNKT